MKFISGNRLLILGVFFGAMFGVMSGKLLEGTTPHAFADGKQGYTKQAETFRNAAKVIGPSVVNITNMQKRRVREGGGMGFNSMGMPFYKRPTIKEGLYPMGVGSGFVFDAKNGYILTNNHVIDEGDSFVIRLADKRELEATLVGTDPQTDIAVLKTDARALTESKLGNSDELEVGDWVIACGNPFGLLEQTVTAGIISAKGRRGLGLSNYEDFLQTDAAINQGNSGGPLVNLDGEVVGINTAIFSKTGGYQGVGFSIPINQAKNIARKLIHDGKVVRGWLGVEMRDLTPGEMTRNKVEAGISVEGVFMNGPAHKAAMQPGDVVLKMDGKAVKSTMEVSNAIADLTPEARVSLVVKRREEIKNITVVVGQQPRDWQVNNTNRE